MMKEIKKELETLWKKLELYDLTIENLKDKDDTVIIECLQYNPYREPDKFEIIYNKTTKRFLTADGDDYESFWRDVQGL